jgi:hypothetical protein
VLEAQTTQEGSLQEALGRLVHLEATLATMQTTLAQVTAERDKLRRAYEQLKEQVELLRRRIHMAKAERIDVEQLEMEFATTKAKLEAVAIELGDAAALPVEAPPPLPPPPPPADKARPKPTGRRNLAAEDIPEERIEILDPALEGAAIRIGFEESSRLSPPAKEGPTISGIAGTQGPTRRCANGSSPWPAATGGAPGRHARLGRRERNEVTSPARAS